MISSPAAHAVVPSTAVTPGPGPARPSVGETDSTAVTLSVETAFTRGDSEISAWDAAVLDLGGTLYMSYDWLRTWWQHYGHGCDLHLLVFRRGLEIVGLLPLYVQQFGRGPFRTLVARLVGANVPPKTFDPPVHAKLGGVIFALTSEYLFQRASCDFLSFGPVSERWPAFQTVSAFLGSEHAWSTHSTCRFVPRDVQTWFQLPPTFDQYLDSLESSERKSRLKRLRHLEKEYQVSTDIVTDPSDVETEFDAFVHQHTTQWNRIGRSGHFAAWPVGERYNRAQVRAQARHGRIQFFRMLADDQVVSNRYTFRFGDTLYSELPARAVGEPWDKLGIGAISLLKFNESVIQSGISAVDSGLGSYDHKAQLGGDQIPVGVWHVAGPGLSRLRASCFVFLSSLIRFAAHKVWYKRVLPKMPSRFRRTQALWWLRWDA